jgi:hypothetical protein
MLGDCFHDFFSGIATVKLVIHGFGYAKVRHATGVIWVVYKATFVG